MVPPDIVNWISSTYPRPKVDPDWIDACYTWILEQMHLDPATQMHEIIDNIELQLLDSDLSISMLTGTGFPHDISTLNKVKLKGPPILVEILSVTEIGTSAFQLQNIRQTRIDREDLGGLVGEALAQEDEGPIPKYPRTMLKLELSDGTVSIPAIEYRRLHELDLVTTPLGYKIILRDVMFRRGIAFLEPDVVTMKGHQTEDRDQSRDFVFVSSLNKRLGKSTVTLNTQESDASTLAPTIAPSANRTARSPLQERTLPLEATDVHMETFYGDVDLPRKRRVPASSLASSTAATLVESQYFHASPRSTEATRSLTNPRRQARSPSPDADEPGSPVDLPRANKAPTPAPGSDFDYGGDIDDDIIAAFDEADNAFQQSGPERKEPSAQANIQRQDVILIDDEEEDKENVPVPTRRVRRRMAAIVHDSQTSTRQDPEVIELSSDSS